MQSLVFALPPIGGPVGGAYVIFHFSLSNVIFCCYCRCCCCSVVDCVLFGDASHKRRSNLLFFASAMRVGSFIP